MLKRISITGPESTGKSVLAEALATHYGEPWVKEYAREYLETLNRPYDKEDIRKILEGQLNAEESMAYQAGTYLFCDTDPLVTKIWSEFKYRSCDPWIIEQTRNHRYDLYLLCDIDLPWIDDPLREHPGKREELFQLYQEELKNLQAPYRVIRGAGQVRLQQAILAVEWAFK